MTLLETLNDFTCTNLNIDVIDKLGSDIIICLNNIDALHLELKLIPKYKIFIGLRDTLRDINSLIIRSNLTIEEQKNRNKLDAEQKFLKTKHWNRHLTNETDFWTYDGLYTTTSMEDLSIIDKFLVKQDNLNDIHYYVEKIRSNYNAIEIKEMYTLFKKQEKSNENDIMLEETYKKLTLVMEIFKKLDINKVDEVDIIGNDIIICLNRINKLSLELNCAVEILVGFRTWLRLLKYYITWFNDTLGQRICLLKYVRKQEWTNKSTEEWNKHLISEQNDYWSF